MVTASAPGKLLLLGDHSVVYGHPCIVTAVDQRLQVTIEKNGKDSFHLSAPDLGLEAYTKTIGELGEKELPKSVRFVEMLYKRFLDKHPQDHGINVTTKSEFESGFGFGSSSAVTVAFAKALVSLYQIELTNQELFHLCYQAVLDVQGVGSGFDIAAAIWGGTLYYVSPAKVVETLEIEKLPLIVGYTGIKADTPTLVRMVAAQRAKHRSYYNNLFAQASDLVEQGKEVLKRQDWKTLGKLMHHNQSLLADMEVSSLELDRLIDAAEQAGSDGAKLSGAGGGDCMIALAESTVTDSVSKAIEAAGGKVQNVSLNAEGVRVESSTEV